MMKKTTNPISGVGTDILEIERIRRSIKRHGDHLLDRLFTQTEKEYCLKHKDPAPFFTARFCAKEAIAKALGTGIGKNLSWLDIEIQHTSSGKPIACLSEKAMHHFNHPILMVSISHTHTIAMATAILICQ